MSDERLKLGPTFGLIGGLVILIYGAVEIYFGATLPSVSNIGGLPV